MAFNPSPKVADARALAKKWKADQAIILLVHRKSGTLEYASYGETRQLYARAAETV